MAGEQDKITGAVKEKVGAATGNDRLEGEGKGQRAAGKIEGAIDGAREKAEGLVDAVKDKLHEQKDDDR